MPRKQKLPRGMIQRGDMYYACFRCKGELIRRRLSSNFATAKSMLVELRARADRAELDLLDNKYSWEESREFFLLWSQQAVRGWKQYETDLDIFEKYNPIISVNEISEEMILRFRKSRLEEDKPPSARTINRQVGTINNLMNKLVRAKKIAHNPVAGLKELEHIPEKERRALTIAEAEELMKQSPKHWRDIWRFFMVSGMRHDELVEFQFSDIDYDRKIATVQKKNAKSKKAREIPLEDFVLADLREREKLAKHRKPARGVRGGENFSQDHVFVTRQNTPRKNNVLRQFYAFAKKAGIKDAHPNGSVDIQALRVTFTTWMINGNASPKAVQKILGHSTLELTMGIYTKANDASKHEALLQHPLSRVVVREGIHPEQMTIDLFQELFDGLIKTNLSQEESLDILSKAGFAFAFMNANLPKVNATKRN